MAISAARWPALWIVGGIAVLRLIYAASIPLSPQETYYWEYSRHLALSYFDHPPLAAWTIGLTTSLFGSHEWALRLGAVLYSSAAALLLYEATASMRGPRAALLVLAALLCSPLFALGSVVFTPDPPLVFAWSLALYGLERVRATGEGRHFLTVGLGAGLAMLSKYTGALIPLQVLLALLLVRPMRRWLSRPEPYVGLLLSLAVFSPVLYWNATHGFASFAFQSTERAADFSDPSALRLGRFLGLQALAVSPLLFGAAWAGLFAAFRRWRDQRFGILLAFAAPGMLFFLALGPFYWVKLNWVGPCYLSAVIAAAIALPEARAWTRKLVQPTLGLAAVLTVAVHGIPFGFVPLGEADLLSGWRELAQRVDQERLKLGPETQVVGYSYKVASELAFHLPGRPQLLSSNALGQEGLAYDYWLDPRSADGRPVLVVEDDREPLPVESLLSPHCEGMSELEPLAVQSGGKPVTRFRIFSCRRFRSQPL